VDGQCHSDQVAYLGGLGRADLFSPTERASQFQIWQDYSELECAIALEEHKDSRLGLDKKSRERQVCTCTSHFMTTFELTGLPTFDANIVKASVSLCVFSRKFT
jgi:hypothetical protein